MISASLSSFGIYLLTVGGYGGLFLLSLLESAAIPIPSELVLPFSGFLASTGQFSLWIVVIVATIANIIGSLILYALGRSGGRWLLERYGRYVMIHKKDLETGDRWFARHGRASVFWGRLLPVVRTFISLPAGIAEMNLSAFVTYTTLGALPWNFVLVYIGYKTGQHWDFLHPYFQKFDIAIIAVIVVTIIWYINKHIRRNTHA